MLALRRAGKVGGRVSIEKGLAGVASVGDSRERAQAPYLEGTLELKPSPFIQEAHAAFVCPRKGKLRQKFVFPLEVPKCLRSQISP